MKRDRIIYWVVTGLFGAMMIMSGIGYFTQESMKESFIHMGFPDYFRIELGIAKIIGAAILLLPMLKGRIKEWAYAGFGITLLSAVVSHVAVGDGIDHTMAPVIALVMMAVSYIFYHRVQAAKAIA